MKKYERINGTTAISNCLKYIIVMKWSFVFLIELCSDSFK